jgi:pantoate--beta-alanine ligase
LKTSRTIGQTRRLLEGTGKPLVLVPTMGALHEGHAALIRRARREAGPSGTVAVSIFVNPAQFGPSEDFSVYPRPLARDLALCRSLGVDLVFVPPAARMYAPDASTFVEETTLSLPLCGRSRPGHFRGVCTVVAKLLNIFRPDVAVFGEKDWQQLAVIRRMVRDLDFPVRITGHPTHREHDGLATSSRNARLSPAERAAAPAIHAALRKAAASARSPQDAAARARRSIAAIPGARVDYVGAADAASLGPPRPGRPARLFAAVFLGRARLIDNIPLPRAARRKPTR